MLKKPVHLSRGTYSKIQNNITPLYPIPGVLLLLAYMFTQYWACAVAKFETQYLIFDCRLLIRILMM